MKNRLKSLTQKLLQEIEYDLIDWNWKLSLQREMQTHYVRGRSEKTTKQKSPLKLKQHITILSLHEQI